jgi:hypothetical protein
VGQVGEGGEGGQVGGWDLQCADFETCEALQVGKIAKQTHIENLQSLLDAAFDNFIHELNT